VAKSRTNKRERVSGRKRAETHKVGFDSTSLAIPKDAKTFRLDKEGMRKVDIIPFRAGKGNPFADEGELHFERTYYVHKNVGPNQDMYVCPAKTAGKPCPICEYRTALTKKPDADEDLIKDLAPKERQLFNVIDVEKPEDGVQIWDISFYLFGKLLDARIRKSEDDDEYEYFADLQDGKTLRLGVEEQSFGGKSFYSVESIDFKNRREGYDEDILEQSHCLDDIVQLIPYDKLKKIFLQVPEDEDDDDDDKPKKGTKKSSAKKKSEAPKTSEDLEIEEGTKVECEEFGVCQVVRVGKDGTTLMLEDEDGDVHKNISVEDVKVVEETEEEDDEEEEEEEKPVKKTAKKKAAKNTAAPKKTSKKASKKDDEEEEEDDDWEEEWDDDEEEEKPKKSPKKAAGKKKAKDEEEEDEDDDDWDD